MRVFISRFINYTGPYFLLLQNKRTESTLYDKISSKFRKLTQKKKVRLSLVFKRFLYEIRTYLTVLSFNLLDYWLANNI